MQIYTVTDAKKQLGALLKQAINGEEIGIVTGAEIVALRRVKIRALDEEQAPVAPPYQESPVPSLRVQEDGPEDDWFFRFNDFQGSNAADLSENHDQYLYGDRA